MADSKTDLPHTINTNVARQLDIPSVRAEIQRAKRALIKPGNLAHLSNGTTVKVSSIGRFSYVPERMLDGADFLCWYDNTKDELNDWVELTFARPVRISRLVVDSNMVRNEGAGGKRRQIGHRRRTRLREA